MLLSRAPLAYIKHVGENLVELIEITPHFQLPLVKVRLNKSSDCVVEHKQKGAVEHGVDSPLHKARVHRLGRRQFQKALVPLVERRPVERCKGGIQATGGILQDETDAGPSHRTTVMSDKVGQVAK